MEKLGPNRAQLFLRNEYTVFSMGSTVALRSLDKKISGELQFCSYIMAVGPRLKECLEDINFNRPADHTLTAKYDSELSWQRIEPLRFVNKFFLRRVQFCSFIVAVGPRLRECLEDT